MYVKSKQLPPTEMYYLKFTSTTKLFYYHKVVFDVLLMNFLFEDKTVFCFRDI